MSTTRETRQQDLAVAHQQWMNSLDVIADPIVLYDKNCFILRCNRAYQQYAGIPKAQIIGQLYYQVFPKKTLPHLPPASSRQTLAKAEVESEIVAANKTFRSRVSRVTDKQGGHLYSIHILEDINERLRTQTELQASEQQYRRLFESAKDGILILDALNGKIIDANPFILNLLSYSFEELSGKALWEIGLIADIKISKRASKELLAEEYIRYEHLPLKSKDGRCIEVEFISNLYPVGDHNVIQCNIRDISEKLRAEQALKTSEQQYRRLFESAKDGILILDATTGKIIDANPFILNLLCYSLDELSGKAIWEIGLVADIKMSKRASKELLSEQYIRYEDMPLKSKDGRLIDVEFISNLYQVGDDKVIQCNIRDITQRKVAEARIKYLSRIQAVLSGINNLIVRVQTQDTLFTEACNIAVETGGFSLAMVGIVDRATMTISPVATAGKDKVQLTTMKSTLSAVALSGKTMVARSIRGEKIMVSNDAQNDSKVLFRKEYTETGVRSMVILPLVVADKAMGVLALYTNEVDFFHAEELKLLTELAGDIAFAVDHLAKLDRLNYLAYYDELTGLANRSLFLERVAQCMRSAASDGQQLALCLIDLERFKNINDSLGRPAGDALLKQVAQWLTNNTADVNLLAHLNADHFAMLLPEVSLAGGLARKIEQMSQDFYNHPFHLDKTNFHISSKTGIALFPEDGDDADTLFKHAEVALKKAKARGERYLFYTQKMTAAVAGKLALENQLRQALDNQEFVLYYQPKLNFAGDNVTSAEALIRWNNPRTGLVSPGQFIPILEETGLIHEVGRWALHQAITDNRHWRNTRPPALRIAVNVSALQLYRADFITEVEQAVALDTHAAQGLELEITESMLMTDISRNIASLKMIRNQGISIAIDDFGTGYSSLSYLAKLPVDTLKIDRAFIIEMTSGQEGLALVSTIINLAHAFKLKVVAEGVETNEQSQLLRLLGCDQLQGFLFSKPLPREEFERRFLN
ncbi:EAL domain-containing protein [Arsukibacterium sp. MJ3]|uniref:bifunctional diguanylate cyclase/phosphodiesterase n=1 Tax=Arsukibacterium sp. MJ3 TaxID=1632859 RepID=UPI00069B1ADF|nr:EAL domain-containing protein [Arsukibacterium sp. MJ3]